MKTPPPNNVKIKPNILLKPASIAFAALLLLSAASATAQTLVNPAYWVGGTADFNTPDFWQVNSAYPSGATNAVYIGATQNPNCANDQGSNVVVLIQDGDPAWLHGDTLAGNETGTSGSYLQTGSTNVTGAGGGNWLRLGVAEGSTGFYTMSNGVLNVAGQAHIGEGDNANAVFNMDGGSMIVNGSPFCMGDADFGTNPVGVLFMNKGIITTAGELWLGEGHANTVGGTGTMYMKGGQVNIGSWFAVGRFGGIGDLEMQGGGITMVPGNGGNITIATAPSTGVINQTGGAITNTAVQTWVAESGNGTWNLNGGLAVLGTVHLTQDAGASGTFNLNGGDLWASEISDNGGASGGAFNFNGGTLHANVDSPNFMHDISQLNIMDNGAKINTEGHDVTISAPLLGFSGSLTKLGDGILTLSGQNSWTGPVTVNQGTLATTTDSYAYGSYSVADGAGFGVAVATYAGAQFYPASLTLGSTSTGTNYLGIDCGAFGNATAAPLDITGNLTMNGTTVVNIASAVPGLGEFPLLSYGTKSGSGTFVLGTLPPGVVANLVPTASGLDLNITGVALDIWTGANSGDWDISTTMNWINAGTLLPVTYTDGDQVLFNDAVTGSTVVNVVTNVIPGGPVNFKNNSNSYTLTGTGSINGDFGLTMTGTNLLTIENKNGYTGVTAINGGLVMVTNLANGGTASAIGAASASPNNLVLGGGTLSYQGPSVTIDRGYNLQGNYGANGGNGTNVGTLDVEGNLTIGGQVTAGINATFVKSGPGTLTYTGVGTNELSAGGNDPGYQVTAGTLVFDGSAGKQVNHSVQEFWVGDTTNAGANIILTNTTLNVDSWFSLSRGNGTSGFVCNGSMHNSTLNVGNFSEGWQNGRPNLCSQVWTMTNSTINDGGAFFIAESPGSVGIANITGNSLLICGKANPMLMGLSVGATGTVVVADNSVVTNFDWLSCGANGYGTLILTNNAQYYENSDFNFGDYGGAATTGNLLMSDNAYVKMIGNGNGVYVGKTAGSFGYVTQTSGMIDARTAGVWQLGQASGAFGQWLQSGGTNYAGGWVSIGRGGDLSSVGIYDISAGLLEQTGTGNGLIVGEQGTGTLTIHGSALVVSDSSNIGVAIGWNAGNGTLNLDGGTLVAKLLQSGTVAGSTGTLNLNGGTLVAGPNANLNFMTNITTVNLMKNTIIDSGTNIIGINQTLTDAGGSITKQGTGTLLLNAANTYAGTTTVSGGAIGGSGSITGPLMIQSGGTLSPGNSIGTFTAGATTLAAGSTTMMEVNATNGASDQLSASSVAYGGTLVLKNLAGNLTVGQSFTLFTTPGTGSFSSVTSITPGQTVTWDTSTLNSDGKVKVLTAVSSAAPTLTSSVTTGAGGSTLNIGWDSAYLGSTLQMQSNPTSIGISTNWVAVPGSTTTNMMSLPIDPAAGSTFYRLVQ